MLTNGAGLVTSDASVADGKLDEMDDQAADVIDCGVERLDWRESFRLRPFADETPSC